MFPDMSFSWAFSPLDFPPHNLSLSFSRLFSCPRLNPRFPPADIDLNDGALISTSSIPSRRFVLFQLRFFSSGGGCSFSLSVVPVALVKTFLHAIIHLFGPGFKFTPLC